jgi:hypothetical protein
VRLRRSIISCSFVLVPLIGVESTGTRALLATEDETSESAGLTGTRA